MACRRRADPAGNLPLSRTAPSPDRLPTNTTTHRHAVHRWFHFIAGFSPEFVEVCCRGITRGVVLDPFAGCGTALVVARQLGHRAIGYEPHPFFVRIARAKSAAPSALTERRLSAIAAALLEGILRPRPLALLPGAPRTFLAKLFDARVLGQLLGAREMLCERGLARDDLAFLLLSRVLDMCSRAQTDGIYKAPTSAKKAAVPAHAIRTVLARVRADARLVSGNGTRPDRATVLSRSSEAMALRPGSVDVVVTSPPYLNNFDFAEMTRMYLYFWGTCDSWRDITDRVRARLIVNTTTALAGHRERQAEYRSEIAARLRPALDDLIQRLRAERAHRAGRKEYDLLVLPYFAQMTRVLRGSYAALRQGGVLHVAVADAALYGVHISTPQLLAQILDDLGFRAATCTKLRSRGHRWILAKRDGSPSGLGEYHVTATRA